MAIHYTRPGLLRSSQWLTNFLTLSSKFFQLISHNSSLFKISYLNSCIKLFFKIKSNHCLLFFGHTFESLGCTFHLECIEMLWKISIRFYSLDIFYIGSGDTWRDIMCLIKTILESPTTMSLSERFCHRFCQYICIEYHFSSWITSCTSDDLYQRCRTTKKSFFVCIQYSD